MIDRSLFLFLNSLHTEWLDSVMVALSGQIVWTPLVLFVFWSAKFLPTRRQVTLFVLFFILTMVVSDVTSSYILKNIFTRLRPCRVEDLIPLIHQFGQKCGGKFGFVSSHASNSFALVTYTLLGLNKKGKWHWLWVLPVIVSLSRIYLGVHYPGDVLGGAVVGILAAVLCVWAWKNSTERA